MGRKENRRRSRLERISERKNSDSNVLPSMEPFFSNENERVYRVHAESGAPGMHNAEEFMRLTHTISDKELNQLLYLQAKDSVEHGVFKEFPENDFGCVMWFMFTFITPEMRDAFPEIVREYLDHEEMFRVELFDDIPYPRPNEKTWDDAFYFRVLGMMVHAARRGSKYSKNFLISLYKVYYKKEYNRLKNLKVLTLLDYLEIFDLDCKERGLASGHTTNGEITFAEQEIERRRHEAGWVDVFGDRLSNYVPFKRGVIDDDEEAYQASQELKQILDSPDEPPLEPVGCRLLIMCEMLGIKVDKTCIGQSLQMNMAREHALKLELYGNDEIRRLIREITERTRAWSIASHPEMADPYLYQSNDKYLHLQIAEEIAYNTFFHMGRSVRLLYDSKKFDLPGLISNVLLTMDGNFPGYELGFGETLYLAMIQYLSECMCDLLITRDTEIEELMHFHRKVYDGEWIDEEEKGTDPKSEKVIKSVRKIKTKEQAVNNNAEVVVSEPTVSTEVEDLKRQLAEKEAALFEAEQKVIQQRALYEKAHKRELELEEAVSEAEIEHAELIALREYVHGLKVEDKEEDYTEEDQEAMIEALQDKNVAVLGGVGHWVKKMKRLFPKWAFILVEDNSIGAANALESADFIYVYTNAVQHTQYYRALSIVKSGNKMLYYLGSSNIAENIKKFYNDLCKRKLG